MMPRLLQGPQELPMFLVPYPNAAIWYHRPQTYRATIQASTSISVSASICTFYTYICICFMVILVLVIRTLQYGPSKRTQVLGVLRP